MKRKSGRFIGEVLDPGEQVLVARGGMGGLGVVQPSKRTKSSGKKKADKLRVGKRLVSYHHNAKFFSLVLKICF